MDEEFSCSAQLHGRPPMRRGRYSFELLSNSTRAGIGASPWCNSEAKLSAASSQAELKEGHNRCSYLQTRRDRLIADVHTNCSIFVGRADHHQTIRGGFSTPDLSRTPIKLTHRGVRLVAREALERLTLGIEAENGVCAEIAHPHLALVIHINGVSMRSIAGKLVVGPALRRWIVDADFSDVPFADPKTPLGIRPDASRAGLLRL